MFLAESGTVKIREISNHFKCSNGTARKVVKELREEGENIIPTRHGIKLDPVADNEEISKLILSAMKWANGLMTTSSRIGVLNINEARKAAELLELDENDLYKLRSTFANFNNMYDIIYNEKVTENKKKELPF
jgi:DeoR/GlpR family transcriptional regulator of sugar metabolism